MDKIDPHKAQWEKLLAKNTKLSKGNGDIYYYRAQACKRLLGIC